MKKIILPFSLMLFIGCVESKKPVSEKEDATKVAVTEEVPEADNATEPEEVDYSGKDCEGMVGVYLNDPDESGTNIRNAPGGDVIYKLIKDELNFEFFITAYEAEGDWLRINNKIGGMENDIEIDSEECWIHGSVVAVDTRNYGGEEIPVYAGPDASSEQITSIMKETGELHVYDICGDWAEVEWTHDNGSQRGWVEAKWLCDNPLTNCC